MADEKFDGPLVGTGPYTLAEWQTGQFARFVRNPNYWGPKGFEDEVVLRFFPDNVDGMFQALKNGEVDYAHDVNPDQFKQLAADPTYTAVAGKANGWTQMAFNTYGTGTGKTIPDGGASTTALVDAAFRDALGYAVDRSALVERVLGGFGDPGNTVVPPVLSDWHVEPDKPRTFDIELAKQKLEAAGYTTDASGNRLDKENKPIKLRLYAPDSDAGYAKSAEFIKDWYGQLGIEVSTQVLTSAALGTLVLPPEGDGTAKYDIELWGWSGNPDPNALLQIFRCDAIGGTSDSQYCNPEYDKLYDLQLDAGGRRAACHPRPDAEPDLRRGAVRRPVLRRQPRRVPQRPVRRLAEHARHGHADVHLRRPNYSLLTDATLAPSPSPSEAPAASDGSSAAPATPAPSAAPSAASDSSNNTLLIGVALVLVIGAVVATLVVSRRRAASAGDDE